jgi:hypothetical protein
MAVNRAHVEQIVATVPGFRTTWEKFLTEWEADESLPFYVGMSELAHYVVDNYTQGTTTEFPNLFGTVEALLRDPDPEFENLIAVGLFEDIQNIASHRSFPPTVFRQWLGTRSLVIWDEIDEGMEQAAAWAEQQKPRWWQFWRRRNTLDPERALSQVESPELRKIIEANFRKKK